MTVFGYIRINYPIDTLNQVKQLKEFNCIEFYVEKTSFYYEVELNKLISRLKKNDTIVIISLSSLGKNTKGIKYILNEIHNKKCYLISIKDKIDTKKNYSLLSIVNLLDELDRNIRSEQVKQSLVKLKKDGKKLGRPKIDQKTINQISLLYNENRLNLREISIRCNVSLGTVHKYINMLDTKKL